MHGDEYSDNLLLADLPDNEIDNLPEPGEYKKRRIFKEPKIVRDEQERTREMREGEFRKWLVKNKPYNSVVTPIETSTATGVPDVFTCYEGHSQWLECKIVMIGPARIRGTQYTYLRKLWEAGGHAKIVAQRLSSRTYKPISIEIYDATDIVSMPTGMFKVVGKELVFPVGTIPWYTWKYGKDDIKDLYLKLLLDTKKFK